MKIAVFDGEAYVVGKKVVIEETLSFSLGATRKKLVQILSRRPNAEIVKVKDGRYGVAF